MAPKRGRPESVQPQGPTGHSPVLGSSSTSASVHALNMVAAPSLSPLDAFDLASLMESRQQLERHIRALDEKVYTLETSYLMQAAEIGNNFDGGEYVSLVGSSSVAGLQGFIHGAPASAGGTTRKAQRQVSIADRVFSATSVTALAAVEEIEVMKKSIVPLS